MRLWTKWKLKFASSWCICSLRLLLLSTDSFIEEAGSLRTDHQLASILAICLHVFAQLLRFECLAQRLHHVLRLLQVPSFAVDDHHDCPCSFSSCDLLKRGASNEINRQMGESN